jgi:N-acetylmuramoyl-L-alanine amidase
MIILTAGHTGPNSGAQCATTQFDEGAENIWLRNRIAEILTNDYGLVVLMDDDRASLKLLTKALSDDLSLTELTENTDLTLRVPSGFDLSPTDDTDFVIDLHFNAHGNPQARGTETIVADDATELELRMASRLAHVTADSLEIPLRCIKSESQTPHRRLAMLHLTPQSIILEVCFCTSPEDVEAYRKNREKLAAELAWAIAGLITF